MKIKVKFLLPFVIMVMACCGVYAQSNLPPDIVFPKFLKNGGVTHYLAANMRYPNEGLNFCWQGKSIIKFVITTTGKVDSAFVQKSSFPAFDAEALRVVNSMPKWKPALNNGKPVNCWFTLPVAFKFMNIRLDYVVQNIETKELFITDGTIIPVHIKGNPRNLREDDLDLTVTAHEGRCSRRIERGKMKYIKLDNMALKDSTTFVSLDDKEDKFYIKKEDNYYRLVRKGMYYSIANHHDEFLEATSYFPKENPKGHLIYCSIPFFRQGDKYYFDGKLYKKVD